MELQEYVNRIKEVLKELVKQLGKIFERIEECERLPHRPPKWYIKANQTRYDFKQNIVYHCRNNC